MFLYLHQPLLSYILASSILFHTSTSKMSLSTTRVHEWVRDGYIISTDPSLIDISALNAAFESDQLPWARALPEEEMKTLLEKSVCFGLYSPTAQALPAPEPKNESTSTSEQSPADTIHEVAERVRSYSQSQSQSQPHLQSASASKEMFLPTSTEVTSQERPAMIGLARLITDCVTVVWLTDVYVLPEWQGRGLGSWLNQCIKEWVDMMPHLRRLSLIAQEGRMEQTYAKVFGTERMEDEGTGYRIYSAKGRGGQV